RIEFDFADGQSFISVGAAKTLDDGIALVAEDLERKEVFPLRQAGMKSGHNFVFRAKQYERIVLESIQIPVLCLDKRRDLLKFPCHETEQIHAMNALFHQLAAPHYLGIGSPFILIARSPTNAVAG